MLTPRLDFVTHEFVEEIERHEAEFHHKSLCHEGDVHPFQHQYIRLYLFIPDDSNDRNRQLDRQLQPQPMGRVKNHLLYDTGVSDICHSNVRDAGDTADIPPSIQ